MAGAQISFILPLITLQLLMISGTPKGLISSTIFSMKNRCNFTIWPVVVSNAGVPPLPVTGHFALHNGESKNISAPPSWSGRLWGRTVCSKHNSTATNELSCLTGGVDDDGPATLAELNIETGIGLYAFYVSLVEGYNIPMEIVPVGGGGEKCRSTDCVVKHLNNVCPSELKVINSLNGTVGCKSACQAFNRNPKYCRKASPYSDLFKKACPLAYTYIHDNSTTIYSCYNAPVYVITFCPFSPATSHKSFEGQGTMNDQNGGGQLQILLAILSIVVAIPSTVVAILQIRSYL